MTEQVMEQINTKLKFHEARLEDIKREERTTEGYIIGEESNRNKTIKEILSIPEILIKDPDQSLPECPYSYKGWTQYEESICKNAYQQMKDEGWVKTLKEDK